MVRNVGLAIKRLESCLQCDYEAVLTWEFYKRSKIYNHFQFQGT